MAAVSSIYSSRTASSSLLRAYRYQSQAATLRSLSFFNGNGPNESVDFSQTTRDSSLMMSLIQGGNLSLFGGLYKDAAAFNQGLMASVSTAAGLHPDSVNSFLGQLVNRTG